MEEGFCNIDIGGVVADLNCNNNVAVDHIVDHLFAARLEVGLFLYSLLELLFLAVCELF